MTSLRAPYSLSSLAASTLLAIATLAAALPPAFAQTPPAPDGAPTAQQAGGDPPSRVARLDYLSGPVTTEPAGASDWSYATVNRPLTSGDQLWNDQGARSELHIGSTAVRLDQSTSLAILNLDDSSTQLKVGIGTLSTHVRELTPGGAYEIDTPNLALAINGPGDYRVDVAPDGASTTVTVRRGTATAYGEAGQIPIAAGQQLTFSGTNLQSTAGNAVPPADPFDGWAAARDAAEDRSISARYVSRDIPGYQDLDANGTWRETPEYGAVWTPNSTPAGWAPYHTGHWIWQAPWGWTWIDDAPWGFAPYHYGRWAYVDDNWAWVPGPVVAAEPPCYAPALVGFVGGGGGGFDWSVGLAVGGAVAAGVAWFPLAPHEAWRPGWGGWSPRYYERVNRTTIVNNINIHNTYINYRVRNGVTAIPAQAFVHGQPVARFAQHVDPRQWRNAHLGAGAPGIAPVRQSFAGGLRNASYRPPQMALGHPIVATRNPVVPAAFHDRQAQQFARHGGNVPGAGAPVIRSSTPPNYAARPVHPVAGLAGAPNQWAMHNVQLVNRQGPVLQPGQRGPGAQFGGEARGPGGMNPAGGPAPVAVRSATAGGQVMPRGEPGMPGMSAERGGAPIQRGGQGMPPTAGFAPHQPGMAAPAPAGNGVPRPPMDADRPGFHPGQSEPGQSPSWTQPHAPIAQQRANAPFHAGQPQGVRENGVPPRPQFGQSGGVEGQRPQAGNTMQSGFVSRPPEQAHSAPMQRLPAQQPVPQPVNEPRRNLPQPSFGQPQMHEASPRMEPRAQSQPHFEPQQAPRMERPQPHFEPQPAPRMERPQPHFEPQQAPRMEQPQPHFEPRQAPRMEQPRPALQPQPHFERPAAPPPHFEQPRSAPAPAQQAPSNEGHPGRH
ncbi:DUF6600 domain-containing protein [Burkholderia sp. 22PA0099]|uniref:DUF6600 domain-containing protein n=1 Tax=Burkholderia sp. 22PA0099 TaxID=3237372 RepID=UPI0039C45F32